MSILLCSQCGRLFDTDDQVESVFWPLPICEDCVEEDEIRIEHEQ